MKTITRNKLIYLNFAFVIFLYLTGCMQSAEEKPVFSEQDKEAIRTNLDTYMKADPIDAPEDFFSQFAEDIYWVYDVNSPWVGMDGLHKVDWCHTLSAGINAENIEGDGDLAYARGTYTLSLDCKGDTVNSKGVFQSVHQRQADGSWKIKSLLQKQ